MVYKQLRLQQATSHEAETVCGELHFGELLITLVYIKAAIINMFILTMESLSFQQGSSPVE